MVQLVNTADSTVSLGDPISLSVLLFILLVVLLAIGRWFLLLVGLAKREKQSLNRRAEFFALSVALSALGGTVGYMVFVFAEAAAWSC
ncbi:hypothetical protein SH661x_003397 [Planctomicrobium sp. SH661]|uniref:hypothetical protein n=1 Tax=Planctomicrobium sp. SH661 TaxID=3448124 RepID=UPI003F5C3ABB